MPEARRLTGGIGVSLVTEPPLTADTTVAGVLAPPLRAAVSARSSTQGILHTGYTTVKQSEEEEEDIRYVSSLGGGAWGQMISADNRHADADASRKSVCRVCRVLRVLPTCRMSTSTLQKVVEKTKPKSPRLGGLHLVGDDGGESIHGAGGDQRRARVAIYGEVPYGRRRRGGHVRERATGRGGQRSDRGDGERLVFFVCFFVGDGMG